MKQRVTVEELVKLTDDQKARLREWWKPQLHDVVLPLYDYGVDICSITFIRDDTIWLEEGSSTATKVDFLPLLSIGQMVQFIEEKRPIKGISKNRFDKWFINMDTAQLGYKDELCDSLWEATTQLLKNT